MRMTMEARAALDHIITASNAAQHEAEKLHHLADPSLRAAEQFVADCRQKADDRAETPEDRA